MSAISSISGGFSALSYRSMNSVMQDMQAAEETEEDDGDLMVETEDSVEIEAGSEEDSDDSVGAGEESPLGGQIDAWG